MIYEHIIASEYGWDLETIRKTSKKDIENHVSACLAKRIVDRKFQTQLAGASAGIDVSKSKPGTTGKGKGSRETIHETIRPTRKYTNAELQEMLDNKSGD